MMMAGGDCPGLNTVIRAAAKPTLGQYHFEVMGIEDGFQGLIQNRMQLVSEVRGQKIQ
jgi:ATP-dependent phosphofructokinase / diphosphate-dependent phosphofructokinase